MGNSVGVLGRPRDFIPAICSCMFLYLAFPLCMGREWARRALLVLPYCLLCALALVLFFTTLPHSRTASASVHPALEFVIGVCALVCVLTPPAFLLAALHHADIRRAFQPKNASKQAPEPTADRRENSSI